MNRQTGATRGRYLCAALLGCCAVASVHPAHAELTFGLGVGAGYSDNVTRTGEGEVDETIGTANLNLDYTEQSSRLDADVLADLAYRDYLDDTFDSEVVGGVDAQARFNIAPERFLWTVEDNFGQVRQNPFQAARPNNREYINHFTTGPDLLLRLGGANGLRLSGRYSNTAYEESDLDSDRLSGSVAIERSLSANSVLSLVGSHETVEYDDGVFDSEYDVQSVYLQFAAEGARTRLSTQLGHTQLDQFGETSDGVHAQLDLTRQLSAATSMSIGGGSRFSSAGDIFRRIQRRTGVDHDGVAVQATEEAFEDRFAFAGWSFQRNRTTLALDASYNEERYERSTELDRSYMQWSARFSRRLRSNLSLHVDAIYDDYDYEALDEDADELRLRGGFNWSVLPRVGLALTYGRIDRSSDGPDSNDEFTENQFWLTLNYTPRSAQ